MASTPSARDRVLDAFEDLLADQSERAATLEAVATRAGVSKGGLLYHFGSKDALIDGVLTRLADYAERDLEAMRKAPEGPVAYFLRTSIPAADAPFERSIVAVARLAQSSDPRARDALSAMQRNWIDVLEEAVGDPLVARTIMLIGDGMYYNAVLLPDAHTVLREGSEMERLIELVQRFASRD